MLWYDVDVLWLLATLERVDRDEAWRLLAWLVSAAGAAAAAAGCWCSGRCLLLLLGSALLPGPLLSSKLILLLL